MTNKKLNLAEPGLAIWWNKMLASLVSTFYVYAGTPGPWKTTITHHLPTLLFTDSKDHLLRRNNYYLEMFYAPYSIEALKKIPQSLLDEKNINETQESIKQILMIKTLDGGNILHHCIGSQDTDKFIFFIKELKELEPDILITLASQTNYKSQSVLECIQSNPFIEQSIKDELAKLLNSSLKEAQHKKSSPSFFTSIHK